ncbi:V-type ATP synthase subunit E [Clostridiaceae bacterium 35-E11]
MVTIEEKLGIFTKLVLDKVQHEFDEELQEINRNNTERIQAHQARLEKEREKTIKEMTKKAEVEKNKMISKAHLDQKRKILFKRQEILEKQIQNLKKKALLFTDTEEYKIHLKKQLREILTNLSNEKAIILYLTHKDMTKHKVFLLQEARNYGFDGINIEVSPAGEEIIGGMIGVNQSRTLKIDASILSKIEENRQLIGKKLYDALKKAGGLNG